MPFHVKKARTLPADVHPASIQRPSSGTVRFTTNPDGGYDGNARKGFPRFSYLLPFL